MNLTLKGSDYLRDSAFIGRSPVSGIINCVNIALFSNTVAEMQAGARTELSGSGYTRLAVSWSTVAGYTTEASAFVPRQRFNTNALQWGPVGTPVNWGWAKSIGLCASSTPTTDDVYWVGAITPNVEMKDGAVLPFAINKLMAELGPFNAESLNRLWGKWYAYFMMNAHLAGTDKNNAQFMTVANWTGSGPFRALALHLANSYDDVCLYASRGLNEFSELSGNGYDKSKVPIVSGAGPKPIMFTRMGSSFPYYLVNTADVVFEQASGTWDPHYAIIMSWYLASGSTWSSALPQEVIAVIPIWDSVNSQSFWRTIAGQTLTVPAGSLTLNIK